ncbi:hypothetical protein [Elizabethkingia occulta]|nr:hypothetical protein [Elizabethkingia occulta]
MKKLLIITFLCIFSVTFAQISFTIQSTLMTYRHKKATETNWSDWSENIPSKEKINIDIPNNKITFSNPDNQEVNVFTIVSGNYDKADRVVFLLNDKENRKALMEFISEKDYDSKIVTLKINTLEIVYICNPL